MKQTQLSDYSANEIRAAIQLAGFTTIKAFATHLGKSSQSVYRVIRGEYLHHPIAQNKLIRDMLTELRPYLQQIREPN